MSNEVMQHSKSNDFKALRFDVQQFDGSTFQVVDIKRKVEVCVCFDVNYENQDCPAKVRAQAIADALNATWHKLKHLGIRARKAR